jgi:hypothetical protein
MLITVIQMCNQYCIPKEIQDFLLSFLFFKNEHQRMIYTLKLAHFRRNENHPVLDSIKNPHWYFYENKKTSTRYLYMQARNCNQCGEYRHTQNVLYPFKIVCRCHYF